MLRQLIRREMEDEEFDLLDACREIGAVNGWSPLILGALEILEDPTAQDMWRSAANVIYWTPSTGSFPVPKMAILARLYRCLELFPGFGGEGLDDAENLVWSIATEFKGVNYLSDWSPQHDPEVRHFLEEMA